MRICRVPLAGLLSALMSVACATTPGGACDSIEQRMVADTIYFGTARPGGKVSDEEWSQFLATAITPSFPEGLSVSSASGQWKSADGSIVHETSYVLHLVHPASEQSEAAIRAAMSQYKARFQQQAVLRVKGQVCTSF